jgi:hypothetical protein
LSELANLVFDGLLTRSPGRQLSAVVSGSAELREQGGTAYTEQSGEAII